MKIVNQCYSIGRLFAVIAPQAAGSPLVDRANVTEREDKMRRGNGRLIRMPFTGKRPTLGLVLGVWNKPRASSTDAIHN